MNISKTILVLSLGLMISGGAVSCKKSSKEDTNDYLTCTMRFDLPAFLESGASADLTPTGGQTPSGGSVGYYWIVSTNTSQRDTTRLENDPASVTGVYHLEVPEDFTGTLTVTLYAFADGFYNTSQAGTSIIVNKETSLNVPGLSDDDPKFEDPRDGKSYRYVSIGGLDWFASNLAYDGVGVACSGSALMGEIFGNFYKWNEAVKACPEGWRIPDADDWKSLAEAAGAEVDNPHGNFKGIAGHLMADAYFNDEKMWAYFPSVPIDGSTGFAALPLGYSIVDGESYNFNDFRYYSVFWTGDEASDEQAYYRYIYESVPDVNIGKGYKDAFAAPVRCVRNSK